MTVGVPPSGVILIINNFDQIEAPSKIGETQLHALNLDWRRFVTHQTAERKASGRFTESNRR